MPSLQPEQITHYREQGYVLPQGDVFDPSRFEKLVAVFEEDLERYGADDLDVIHDRDDRLFEFLFDDAVLDMVEPLVGPDIALWSSHFISKPPRTGRETPWHEDATYWDGRMDNWERVLTVWVALDRVDTENGCMRVIPGTHLGGGFSEYRPVDQTVQTFHAEITEVDESKAVDFELERGQFSIHDGRIMHGAKPNTSSVRRTGYTMRYFPASVRVLPVEQNAGWKIWLARGKDTAGNTYEPV